MKDIPAFPLNIIYTRENERFNGMTLRDYFAAKAMQGILTNETSHSVVMKVSHELAMTEELAISKMSYVMADAMMKARTDGL
jgi:hypothetical protein